jgi:hypothetical protein
MGEVVSFTRTRTIEYHEDTGTINGVAVPKPKTPYDYQLIMKQFLDRNDYEEVILGIMDREYYDDLDPVLKNLVDHYFNMDA